MITQDTHLKNQTNSEQKYSALSFKITGIAYDLNLHPCSFANVLKNAKRLSAKYEYSKNFFENIYIDLIDNKIYIGSKDNIEDCVREAFNEEEFDTNDDFDSYVVEILSDKMFMEEQIEDKFLSITAYYVSEDNKSIHYCNDCLMLYRTKENISQQCSNCGSEDIGKADDSFYYVI